MSLTCGDCRLIQDCSVREMDQPACDRVEPWPDEIKEQLEFVDWLKSKGIYNPFETALTMQRMHAVWKKMKD